MPYTFGELLTDEMKRLGGKKPITYEKMAKLLGSNKTELSRVINQGKEPPIELVAALSKVSNLSWVTLLEIAYPVLTTAMKPDSDKMTGEQKLIAERYSQASDELKKAMLNVSKG